jgi:hypothetical protein
MEKCNECGRLPPGRPKGLKHSQATKDKIALALQNKWLVRKEKQKKGIEDSLRELDKKKNLVEPVQVTNEAGLV